MARLLALSLLRVGESNVWIFTNAVECLVEHPAVRQIALPTSPVLNRSEAIRLKFNVAPQIDAAEWDRIFFIDSDVLLNQPLARFIPDGWDLLCCEDTGLPRSECWFNAYMEDCERDVWTPLPGLNSGFLGFRSSVYHDLCSRWSAIDAAAPCRAKFVDEQPAWNRLVTDYEREHPADVATVRNHRMTYPCDGQWYSGMEHVAGCHFLRTQDAQRKLALMSDCARFWRVL